MKTVLGLVAALALFSFFAAWNQYLWPLIVTKDARLRTVQIGLRQLRGESVNDINVTLDVQSTQAVVTKVLGQDYQFATFSNPFNDPDPKWGNSFVSNANPSPTGWKNSAYDADIADAKATLDPAKRIADFGYRCPPVTEEM